MLCVLAICDTGLEQQHVPAALECPMRNVRSLYMKEFYFREDPVLGKYFPDIPV